MNPLQVDQLKRGWQPLAAVLVAVVFLLLHVAAYLPLKARLAAAETKAHSLGIAFDPDSPPSLMPPRVVALVAGNTLAREEAQTRGTSGALTADLFDAVTSAANHAGVSIVATEPGATLQQEQSVLVKAHVRASCTYSQFTHMLDALARGDQLLTIDRFSLVQTGSSRLQLELWVTRLILKRPGVTR
jgi:hypothetical protein